MIHSKKYFCANWEEKTWQTRKNVNKVHVRSNHFLNDGGG
ncbi:hypothetical protein HMPREF0494_0052 [Limosilactobacillus antri DSM 16041]|uniref:Uncharacterized protein n=1 Tax=Limosilactobacillus antri DSM 16041 TaxID=525309 RepID=C8P408_9LACO|nr:hypothetical protein HMPREF0494_0052 [Limosilactobacillus antri DSM 16041]